MKGMTILVPLDRSQLAEAALRFAVPIALATRSSLRLLSVVERESCGLGTWPDDVHTYVEDVHLEDAHAYLVDLVSALQARDVAAEAVIRMGEPRAAIREAAAEPNVAMVVMATLGRSGVRDVLMGSTAERVVHSSPRPILLIRPRADSAPWQPVALRRIMTPLDGSELGESAVPVAADLIHATGAELVLVRVEPWLTVGSAPYGSSPDFVRMEEATAEVARQYLADVASRISGSGSVLTEVLRGAPLETLATYAERTSVDLVVMATHGRSGLGRLILGSMADELIGAGVPTLLVKQALAVSDAAALPALVMSERPRE